MKEVLYKVVLIVCGVILLAGIVLTAFFVDDQSVMILLCITFVLYILYILAYAKRKRAAAEKKATLNRNKR